MPDVGKDSRDTSATGRWPSTSAVARFEADWRGGLGPRIEAFLDAVDPADRPALLEALIKAEVAARREAGERPVMESYRRRFPELVARVDAAFAGTTVVEPVARPSGSPGDDEDRTLLARAGTTRAEGTEDGGPPTIDPSTQPDRSGSRYRIVRHHARGGLGDVYLAEDEELGRKVALKEIQARHVANPQYRARFLLEAEVTGLLEHPGIVPVHGLGSYPDGRPFYAMRFIKGESLKDAIAAFRAGAAAAAADPGARALGLRRLLGRFEAVCDAIEYAHSRGVLHRDLKPANIMLGRFGETLVVDWGLAKIIGRPDVVAEVDPAGKPPVDPDDGAVQPSSSSGVEPTRMDSAHGTPQYMSPEQAAGQVDRIGVATDVYGLGATLYYLLTGRAPFPAEPLAVIKPALIRGEFPRPAEVDPEVAPALEAICLKAMATDPKDRYPSARALADDVERWLADEPATAYRDPPLALLGRWVRRHRTAVAGSAALLVASVIALAINNVLVGRERDQADRSKQVAIDAVVHADDNLRLTLQAIDSLMLGVTSDRLATTPGIEIVRGYLADEAVKVAGNLLRPRPGDPVLQYVAAPIYNRAAVVHRLLGRFDQAFGEFRRSIELYENLLRVYPGDREARATLTRVLIDYAEGLRIAGLRTAAIDHYGKARREAERLRIEAPGDLIYLRPLARARYNLAEVLLVLERYDEAGAAFDEAVALLDRLIARDHDDVDRYLRTYPLRGQGIVARERGRLDDSDRAFDRALKNLDDLDARGRGNNNVDYLRATIRAERARLIALDRARTAEAEAEFCRAVDGLDKLVGQFPALSFYRQDLAETLLHRATFRADLDSAGRRDAEADADRARTILETLRVDQPRLAGVQGRLGQALGLLGKLATEPSLARPLLERAIHEQDQAIRADPDIPRVRRALQGHRDALGRLPAP